MIYKLHRQRTDRGRASGERGFEQPRLVCRTGRRHRELPHLAWRQGGSHLGPRVRGNRPSGVERHT
jgi:hypothetical protein